MDRPSLSETLVGVPNSRDCQLNYMRVCSAYDRPSLRMGQLKAHTRSLALSGRPAPRFSGLPKLEWRTAIVPPHFTGPGLGYQWLPRSDLASRFCHSDQAGPRPKTAIRLSVRQMRIEPQESRKCRRVTLSASTAGSLTESRQASASCLANCHTRHNQRNALLQTFRTTALPRYPSNSIRPTSLGDECRF